MTIWMLQRKIREAIATQICPWCGRGPFAMLAVHTNKAHDIDKWQLRELAGYTTRQPLCDPEVSEKMRQAQLDNPHLEKMQEALQRGRKPQRWTTAGINKNSATIKAWTVEDPERHRKSSSAAAAAITPAGAERRTEAIRRWQRENKQAMRERAIRVLHTPEVDAKRRAARTVNLQPCGTRAAYRRGCRCNECREANRAYKRSQYRSRINRKP